MFCCFHVLALRTFVAILLTCFPTISIAQEVTSLTSYVDFCSKFGVGIARGSGLEFYAHEIDDITLLVYIADETRIIAFAKEEDGRAAPLTNGELDEILNKAEPKWELKGDGNELEDELRKKLRKPYQTLTRRLGHGTLYMLTPRSYHHHIQNKDIIVSVNDKEIVTRILVRDMQDREWRAIRREK